MTDERQLRIAADLKDAGRLDPFLYRVWRLHKDGHTFYAIRNMLRAENLPDELIEGEHGRGRRLGNSDRSLRRYYQRAQMLVEEAESDQRLIEILEGCEQHRIGGTGERGGEAYYFKDGVLSYFL